MSELVIDIDYLQFENKFAFYLVAVLFKDFYTYYIYSIHIYNMNL